MVHICVITAHMMAHVCVITMGGSEKFWFY